MTAVLGLLEQLQKSVLFHPPCQPLTVLAVLLTCLGVTKGDFSVSRFLQGLAGGAVNWILLKERAWRSLKTGNICSSPLQGQAVQPCLGTLLCQGQKGSAGVTLSSWPYVAHETSLNLFVSSGTEREQNVPFAYVPNECTAQTARPRWLRCALAAVMGYHPTGASCHRSEVPASPAVRQ